MAVRAIKGLLVTTLTDRHEYHVGSAAWHDFNLLVTKITQPTAEYQTPFFDVHYSDGSLQRIYTGGAAVISLFLGPEIKEQSGILMPEKNIIM